MQLHLGILSTHETHGGESHLFPSLMGWPLTSLLPCLQSLPLLAWLKQLGGGGNGL